MTDSKVQIRRNFKIIHLKNCEYRIRWMEQRIKQREIFWDEHLDYIRKSLQHEKAYRDKLKRQITATTC